MDIKMLDDFLNYSIYLWDPADLLEGIIQKAKEYLPPHQIPWIQQAYDFAKKAHEWQVRLSGEAYIIHPVRSAEFLMEIKPDIETIQACLLHDVVEDTAVTVEEIETLFGKWVANLCEWLVKVSKIKYKWEERHLETIKKTFLAMAKDLRVIFIKLCDRIHNIQTLQYHPNPSKRQKIAQETMKIFVPIARRLWLYYYQLYLENWAFKVLQDEEFTKIFNYLKKYFGNSEKYEHKWMKILTELLQSEWICLLYTSRCV